MTPLFIIGLPLLLVLVVGLVGSTRRLGFWWSALLAVVLTPIGGFFAAVLSGPRRARRPKRVPPHVEAAVAADAAVTAAVAAAAAAAATRPTPKASTAAAHIAASPQP